MANGAGFQVDAITTLRSNRTLLKGDGRSKYKNFDTHAYPVNGSVKKAKYKTSSPEMLEAIREHLKTEEKKTLKSRITILFISVVLAALTMIVVGQLYLYFFY